MARRYQDYRPDAGLARMSGGLGFGMAQAGKMTADYAQQNVDNAYRDNQAETQRNQFKATQDFQSAQHNDRQKLGYARIKAADKRNTASNKLGWANHSQRKAQFNKPSYIVRETDDGIMAYNQYDLKQEPVNLGKSKPKVPTELDVAKLAEAKQKNYQTARANAATHYGDEFENLSPVHQDYLTNEYMNGIRNHKLLGTGWGDGDVRVKMPQTQQVPEDSNASISNLEAILAEQNRLLKSQA